MADISLTEKEQKMGAKKLIEVALPLEAINKESAREKSIRHKSGRFTKNCCAAVESVGWGAFKNWRGRRRV